MLHISLCERTLPGTSGICPHIDTRCSVVFRPYTPQKCAGIRMEPARSLPISSGVIPTANAAAAPPLEPPDVRATFQGLLVRPNIGLSDWMLPSNGDTLVLPMMITPAALSRAATV